jgi:hypothetical protein
MQRSFEDAVLMLIYNKWNFEIIALADTDTARNHIYQ